MKETFSVPGGRYRNRAIANVKRRFPGSRIVQDTPAAPERKAA